jgi:hypothetical protein
MSYQIHPSVLQRAGLGFATASLATGFWLIMAAAWLESAMSPLAASISSADYFYPLVPQAAWEYKLGNNDRVNRVVLPTSKTIHNTTTLGVREVMAGQLRSVIWVSANAGVRLHRMEFDETAAPEGYHFDQPIIYLPATVEAGGAYPYSVNVAAVGQGESPPAEFPGTVQGNTQVIGFETITAPAGTFNCLKVVIAEDWSMFGIPVYAFSYTWWLAKGVGIVKSIDETGESMELISYSIPSTGAPTITTQPQSQTVDAGVNVTFTVAAAGASPLGYQWRKNGVNLAGQTAATLTLSGVTQADAGNYSVIISNAAGSVTSAEAALTVNPVTPPATPPRFLSFLRLANKVFELVFQGEGGQSYQIQASTNLTSWVALTNITGGISVAFRDEEAPLFPRRFYRLKLEGPAVAPVAVMPQPGQLYPEGTRFGGPLFGVEFTIPPKWKGGLRAGSPLMIFASDTEPGVILETLGFAWTRDQIMQDTNLLNGFESDMGALGKVFFQPTDPANPLKTTGTNRISAEYSGQGQDASGNPTIVYWNIEIVTHPSGGCIIFIGATTQEYQTKLKPHLLAFVESVKTTPRSTHTEYVNQLNSRSYKWSSGGNDWYSNQPGIYSTSASLSNWSENYAFFCAQGTFEVNRTTETYASTTSPSHGYMSLSGSSTTKEFGQWTIVQIQEYGNLLLLVTLSGYQIIPVRIDPDGSVLVGQNKLTPHGVFNCGE